MVKSWCSNLSVVISDQIWGKSLPFSEHQFSHLQTQDDDGVITPVWWGCWEPAVRAGLAAAVACASGLCPHSADSADLSPGTEAFREQKQMGGLAGPSQGASSLLSKCEEGSRRGLKKISVH